MAKQTKKKQVGEKLDDFVTRLDLDPSMRETTLARLDAEGVLPSMLKKLIVEEELVEIGLSPQAITAIAKALGRQRGWTALMLAAGNGNAGSVKLLLERKANVDARDQGGRTALMLAAEAAADGGTVKLLMDAKADVDARDELGRTALMLAAGSGNAGAVELLVKGKADVNARDESGATALLAASSLPCLRALLAAAADPAAADAAGGTPLLQATRAGRWDCATELLKALSTPAAGAPRPAAAAAAAAAVEGKDGQGWTAVHYALAAKGTLTEKPATAWLSQAERALGAGGAGLLAAARADLEAAGAAARAAAGSAWPQQWRGSGASVTVVNGPASASFRFSQFATVRSAYRCPAGSRGFYELEILDGSLSAPQMGFCGDSWLRTEEYTGNGVGDDGDSWGADGSRQTWWHGGRGGRAGAYGTSWQEGTVLGLACDLAGDGVGRMLVAVNGNWEAAEALELTAGMAGVMPAFTASSGLVRCNLAGPFRFPPPPEPAFQPMAAFPPAAA